MPTEAEIEAAAKSDAEFDGFTWLGLSRTSRERYASRSRAALTAAEEVRGQAVPDDEEFKWHQLDAAEVFATNRDRKT